VTVVHKIALAILVLFVADSIVAASVASARVPSRRHVTCETVRAYVAQVGIARARAVAVAYGLTGSQIRRARRCLSE
jgi:hypothetical protein